MVARSAPPIPATAPYFNGSGPCGCQVQDHPNVSGTEPFGPGNCFFVFAFFKMKRTHETPASWGILIGSTITALPQRSSHAPLVVEHLEHHTYIRWDEIDTRTPREQRMGPGVRFGRPAVVSPHRLNPHRGRVHAHHILGRV